MSHVNEEVSTIKLLLHTLYIQLAALTLFLISSIVHIKR